MPAARAVTQISHQPTVGIETITPETAAAMLAQNTINRNLRPLRINRYANDMKAGAWHIGNDAIAIASDGTMLNGQHRLLAVVQSGVAVDFLILRNAAKESMSAMDTGAVRTSADYFGKAGLDETNSGLLTSTIKQLILFETGNITRDRSGQEITNHAMKEWLDANPEVRASVAAGQKFSSGSRRVETSARTLAIVHFMITKRNSVTMADVFFKQVSTRVGEPDGSPVHAIDSRLRRMRDNRQNADVKVLVAFLIRGWNAYAEGRSVRQMPLETGPWRMPDVARCTRSLP